MEQVAKFLSRYVHTAKRGDSVCTTCVRKLEETVLKYIQMSSNTLIPPFRPNLCSYMSHTDIDGTLSSIIFPFLCPDGNMLSNKQYDHVADSV